MTSEELGKQKSLTDNCKPIEITDEMRKKELPTVIKVFELTNELMEKGLCGFDLTLANGWKISCKNQRFAKQMDVPMK